MDFSAGMWHGPGPADDPIDGDQVDECYLSLPNSLDTPVEESRSVGAAAAPSISFDWGELVPSDALAAGVGMVGENDDAARGLAGNELEAPPTNWLWEQMGLSFDGSLGQLDDNLTWSETREATTDATSETAADDVSSTTDSERAQPSSATIANALSDGAVNSTRPWQPMQPEGVAPKTLTELEEIAHATGTLPRPCKSAPLTLP